MALMCCYEARTTQSYAQVLNSGGRGVLGPLDR